MSGTLNQLKNPPSEVLEQRENEKVIYSESRGHYIPHIDGIGPAEELGLTADLCAM